MYRTAARGGTTIRLARVGVAVLLAAATVGLLGVRASDAHGSGGHLDGRWRGEPEPEHEPGEQVT